MLINRILFGGIILLIISSISHGQNYNAGWSAYSGGFMISASPGISLSSVTGQSFTGKAAGEQTIIRSGFLVHSVTQITGLENELLNIPDKFELSQNYPNPLNPSTRIDYTVPEKSSITLKIFNLLGSEVAQLVNGETEAGRYSVEFNAAGLASGVYFYTLQAGDFIKTKKMILMK